MLPIDIERLYNQAPTGTATEVGRNARVITDHAIEIIDKINEIIGVVNELEDELDGNVDED